MKSRTTLLPTTAIRSATPTVCCIATSPACHGALVGVVITTNSFRQGGRLAGMLPACRGRSGRDAQASNCALERNEAFKALDPAQPGEDLRVRRMVDIALGGVGNVAVQRDIGD